MTLDPALEHELCNQIAIVVGYCELLLHEMPAGNPLRIDLEEMHKAAVAAMDMLRPEQADQ